MENKEILIVFLVVVVAGLVLFNQYQIYAVNSELSSGSASFGGFFSFVGGSSDLKGVDILQSHSTAQSVAMLFPVDKIKTVDDAMNVMIPTGTPDYGQALGVSYDDPVNSLDFLYQKLYPQIERDVKQNDPAVWQRYLNLATRPVGISCEFCCGVGPVGIASDGSLLCGCSHNLAVHALTLWLMKNTDYSDAQIVREVMRWKTIWFPKNMVMIAYQDATQGAPQTAGGSPAATDLNNLPGMVGGC
jgi:hypothetical protein